jgi:hypothetical protein
VSDFLASIYQITFDLHVDPSGFDRRGMKTAIRATAATSFNHQLLSGTSSRLLTSKYAPEMQTSNIFEITATIDVGKVMIWIIIKFLIVLVI